MKSRPFEGGFFVSCWGPTGGLRVTGGAKAQARRITKAEEAAGR